MAFKKGFPLYLTDFHSYSLPRSVLFPTDDWNFGRYKKFELKLKFLLRNINLPTQLTVYVRDFRKVYKVCILFALVAAFIVQHFSALSDVLLRISHCLHIY